MAQHLLQHQAGLQISDKLGKSPREHNDEIAKLRSFPTVVIAEAQIKEEILSPTRPQATPSPSDSATSQRSTTGKLRKIQTTKKNCRKRI